MSENQVEFPWKTSFETKIEPTLQKEPSSKELVIQKIKQHQNVIAIFLAVIFLVMLMKINTPEQTLPTSVSNNLQISIMVPVVAFPKGTPIDPRFLKPVTALSKSFSKAQLLSIFTEEDIDRLDNKLVAKKDLAPYKPIFWTSIEIKPNPTRSIKNIQIIYHQDKGNEP